MHEVKASNTSEKEKLRLARKGLNIFYYGKGKGKTTAAMGLAARAAGAGMSVFILQFVKARRPKKGEKLNSGEWPLSSEILFFEEAAKKLGSEFGKIQTDQLGLGFVGILGDRKEREVHVSQAKEGLAMAKKLIASDKWDVIILDELVSALELNLISEQDILDILKNKPKHQHLVYTGHDPFDGILELTDLASEINMVKHPYYKGILAQKGIDF